MLRSSGALPRKGRGVGAGRAALGCRWGAVAFGAGVGVGAGDLMLGTGVGVGGRTGSGVGDGTRAGGGGEGLGTGLGGGDGCMGTVQGGERQIQQQECSFQGWHAAGPQSHCKG